MYDVVSRSALAQAALLQQGAISVEELTRAYLSRIERLDEGLRAFVQFVPERALAQARALDRERRKSPRAERSLLWGLPTAMKDLHLTRGLFVRLGSQAFRYLWSPVDDVSSASVRRAGMVITGKLSTSELAILPIIDLDLHAPTRNPWDRSRYAGGSSGGSGAAVAAGMMPVAVASDGGGSVRIPAAFCGLVGHKPTRGLLPNPFAPFEALALSVIGPHARSVDDAAALMDVLAEPHDHRESFLQAITRPPKPLRIRFTTQNPVVQCDPAVRSAVEKVLRVLEELGHHVEEGPRFEGSIDEFLPMFQFLSKNMFVPSERSLQPSTRWLREEGRKVSLANAMEIRESFRARVDAWFEGTDLCVTPTVAILPPRVGQWSLVNGEELFRAVAPIGAFTAVFNASGNPATTIPVWDNALGLSLGVQLIGRRGDDVRLLSLARVIMQAMERPLVPLACA